MSFPQACGLVAAAIDAGRIPGAVLGQITAVGPPRLRSAGHAQLTPPAAPMTETTWFDLASLTKPVFTTTAILRLAACGKIPSHDAPLATAIPDLRQYDPACAERQLTFRQCLTHQTHLPAVEPLYTYGQNPQTLRAFILQRRWPANPPTTPPVYSDINFLLLGIAIERLTGSPLADQPLPEGLTFTPDPEATAATEACTWRGRVMRGQVHDENAYALGGAAGHAGLFGTAPALLDFAARLLRGTDPTQAAIWLPQTRTRSLGWERHHPGWSGGDACAPTTIGHTGFTGTGLWLDPTAGHAWTLLTNRVHPTRHADTGIALLRRQVGDLLATG